MKVTILQSIAGNAEPLYDLPEFSFRPGETVELNDALAKAWIASGIAAKAKKGAAVVAESLLDLEGQV
jgi:hypothetical protein